MKTLRNLLCIAVVVFTYIPLKAQPQILWTARYNGPGNAWDSAAALAIDGSGNAYVTGSSNGGSSGLDYFTVKYSSSNGDSLWTKRYSGAGNFEDQARALALDGSGNSYVTGYGSTSNSTDIITIKYTSGGVIDWAETVKVAFPYYDEAYSVGFDASGGVYVAGYSELVNIAPTNKDYYVVKHNSSNGDTVWTRRYDGRDADTLYDYDLAQDLAVGSTNNVFVTGQSTGDNSGVDYATLRYRPDGTLVWTARYTGPGSQSDRAKAVEVRGAFAYVTGASNGTGGDNYTTIKYDTTSGDTVWVRHYNGTGNGPDEARAIAVDASGNVYVTGISRGTTSDDYATVKYDANGNPVWVARYDSTEINNTDDARAIAVDANQYVYVTGRSYNGNNYDYYTIKYNPDGTVSSKLRYNGPAGNDYASAIAVDNCGYVYVTGSSAGSGTGQDYATIKFSPFGCTAIPGDVNASGNVSLVDLIYLYNYIFKGGPPPSPRCSGDVNADGNINMTDYIYLYNYIFYGGPAPIKCKECCL